jgi:peptidoglycan/LPS O-acetylase OafA/YrhL
MRTLFLSVAGVTVFVLVSRLVLAFNGYHTYDYTHTRIDGILYGVMLAILYHYAPETFRSMQARWWVWLTLLACSLALLRVQNVSEAWLASVSWDCGNVMGIAMLMLLYKHREGSRRPAIYRLVAWIGLYSYGIYLWHVSVLGGIIAIAPRLHGWASVAWLALAPMVLGVLLGVLFTKLVEFPALRLRERLFPRRVDSPVGVPAELEPRVLDTQPA